ncbi:hypothetical protein RV15_GL003191 [Enterococcus silesiacus]|uniref:Uncharacterized protein n=1 Tax=Enterococcus silesiacus TaxID=332949 RepID=A0AA91GHT8_9ENTE|nr:hypothetical protein [Enterococcus silesiacus]OJG92398.1 hypothetical protein RV15_GL003191 [Enterococcus silesiacus]
MNKFVKGAVVAGLALSIGGTGFLATATQVHANSAQLVDNTAKINALIQEKQEAINKKKVSRDWQEQKALGIRIGEIEREIQALKKGGSTSGSTGNTTTPTTPGEDTASKIQALIQEKQELINKKKVSTNWQEQQALGIRIGEIEREIQALKNGSSTGGSTGNTTTPTTPATPGEDTASKIQALIQEKQEAINKKKVSRDKNEQKALGIRIGEIEREIQALKNGSSTGGSTGNTTAPSTPVEDNAAKIQALIQEKQELINKKKVSRDKNEQKALGKQIDQIEKEIKQLKKNK